MSMTYNRCGSSGLKLPAISLGLWNNFGGARLTQNIRGMVFQAFDLGVTHFDLANNYGPPPGSAEINFGRLLARELGSRRFAREAASILRQLGVRCQIHQPSYSMLKRWIERGLLDVLGQEGIGCIAFSPEEPDLQPERAGRDRRLRNRCGHQHLGGLQRCGVEPA